MSSSMRVGVLLSLLQVAWMVSSLQSAVSPNELGPASCYVRRPYDLDPARETLFTPSSAETKEILSMPTESLPVTHDWRDVNGTNFLTVDINQHVPHYCGGCWAIASTSALADRIKIMRQAKFPEITLAAQTLLSCVPIGCAGGSPDFAYMYIRTKGIGSSTCVGFAAAGSGINCTASDRCVNCAMNGTCHAVTDFPTFGLKENGDVLGVENMKRELLVRGPIVCPVNAAPIYDWGFGPNRTDVFVGGANLTQVNHVVSVVGWGYDNQTAMPYWVARNSWGAYWGDYGYFRLALGQDQLGIESNACSWGVPTIPSHLA